MLARTLIAAGLIDVLHLIVFPVILGFGKRLFVDTTPPTPAATLRPVSSAATSDGVTIQTYEPAGELRTGSFAEG